MSVDFQASLFDALDAPGATAAGVGFSPLGGEVRRHELTAGAWVDVRPGWLRGADELFSRLVRDVPWQAERRQMYDRVVDVPRLTRFYGERDPLPDPALVEARELLGKHYAAELHEPFVSAGLCYYRDGRDSVAWHGDTTGRSSREDTMVAIVSLGDARRLSLRPRPGGSSGPQTGPGPSGTRSFLVGHGDLLVMGGSCQRTWEHAVLKTSHAVGPRVSVQFRTRGVR